MKTFSSQTVISFIALAMAAGTPLHADPAPGAMPAKAASGHSALWSQVHALEGQEKSALQSLQQQMSDLRNKHQADSSQCSSLGPTFQTAMQSLQAQYDSSRSGFEDQKANLMDQIKPGYLASYNQEKQTLAGTKTQEDQSIKGLHDQEESELQAVRQKYDAQRKTLQQQYSTQRQQIEAQFKSQTQGLK